MPPAQKKKQLIQRKHWSPLRLGLEVVFLVLISLLCPVLGSLMFAHAMYLGAPLSTRLNRDFAVAIANFHCRPEIAAISDALQTKKHCDVKVRISIASDCDLMLRNPSDNRTLSVEFLASWPLRRKIVAIANCDFSALSSAHLSDI